MALKYSLSAAMTVTDKTVTTTTDNHFFMLAPFLLDRAYDKSSKIAVMLEILQHPPFVEKPENDVSNIEMLTRFHDTLNSKVYFCPSKSLMVAVVL